MGDDDRAKSQWTEAERLALRKLMRMALVMLVAIAIAGTIAALLSSAIGGA